MKNQNYYQENAKSLGWGEGKLDSERLEIIHKFTKGKRILDVGCGMGVYVDYLSRNGFEATGVDFVPEFIESAKTGQGTFVKATADKLPFKDQSFEIVLLFDIIEHGDDFKILKEASRVGERLIVIVPRIVDQSLSETGVIFKHYIDKSHLREYSEVDLGNLAKKLNLKVIHLQKVQLLPNFAIFASLFKGPNLFFKAIGKILFLPFLRKDYFTEFLVVLDKQTSKSQSRIKG